MRLNLPSKLFLLFYALAALASWKPIYDLIFSDRDMFPMTKYGDVFGAIMTTTLLSALWPFFWPLWGVTILLRTGL